MGTVQLTSDRSGRKALFREEQAASKREAAQSHDPQPPRHPKPVKWFHRWMVKRLVASLGELPFSLKLWNGEIVSKGPTEVSLHLHDPGVFWKLVRDPFFQFGEAYSSGALTIEGTHLVNFLRMIDGPISGFKSATRPGVFRRMFERRNRNTLSGSQSNIHHHYDIGNDFYRLWLDEQLLYTCAYFEDTDMTVEQAQIAKMDHVCRKIWLQPGEDVVEAGCGWGAFALHMARHYGVKVRAFNISKEQIAYARERAEREGLSDRVEFVREDWRNISGKYDAFVSIGMLEHVGTENYPELGRVIGQSLKPNGRGLIHSIGQNQPRPFDKWIERRVFPGAYPPTLAEMMTIFEDNDLSVLDVENIRLHYAETLAHWLERFEKSAERIAEMFDEKFVRMWRLYLAGSFTAFEADRLQLYQAVFSPEKRNEIPRNRRYMYDADHEPNRFTSHVDVVKSTSYEAEDDSGRES